MFALSSWGSPRPALSSWGSPQPALSIWGSPPPALSSWGPPRPALSSWGSPRPALSSWGSLKPLTGKGKTETGRVTSYKNVFIGQFSILHLLDGWFVELWPLQQHFSHIQLNE